MKLLFLFAGGKYDAEILPLAESFMSRVGRYENVEVVLLPEKNDGDDNALLKRILATDYVILFDERGKNISSEHFADVFARVKESGEKRVVVIVGSAYGVGDAVRERAHIIVSFSKMIFPHQLARVMALEQVYRALSICAGSKYHHG